MYDITQETGSVPTANDINASILQPKLGSEFGENAIDLYDATTEYFAKLLTKGQVALKKTLSLYNKAAQEAAGGQLDVFSQGVKSKEELLSEILKEAGYEQKAVRRPETSQAPAIDDGGQSSEQPKKGQRTITFEQSKESVSRLDKAYGYETIVVNTLEELVSLLPIRHQEGARRVKPVGIANNGRVIICYENAQADSDIIATWAHENAHLANKERDLTGLYYPKIKKLLRPEDRVESEERQVDEAIAYSIDKIFSKYTLEQILTDEFNQNLESLVTVEGKIRKEP